jgi:hypothetical protein
MEIVARDVAVRLRVQGVPSRNTVQARYEADSDDDDADDADDSEDDETDDFENDTDDIMRGGACVAQRQHVMEVKQSNVNMPCAMRTLRTFLTSYRHVVATAVVAVSFGLTNS